MKVQVKPEIYEAIQYDGENIEEIKDFIPDIYKYKTEIFQMCDPIGRKYLKVDSLNVEFNLYIGDCIVKNDRNNFKKQTASEINKFYDIIEE